jgi:hypothetical protein
MRLSHTLAETFALAGLVLFTGAAVAGIGALAFAPTAPRWLALGSVACVAAAWACAAARSRLGRVGSHSYRVLRERTAMTFRLDEEAYRQGLRRARGSARIETLYESLCEGQEIVRLQKFVSESTRLNPMRVLEEWGYACRVAGQGGEKCEVSPEPFLSDSRSLQLDLKLPEPVGRGQTFTVVEELEFPADLEDEGPCLVFQVSYPTASRSVEISFEGLRPAEAGYRIDRGQGPIEAGALEVSEFGDGRRIVHDCGRARVGEQLIIQWAWDRASLPAVPSATEGLIAAALVRQQSMAGLLASQTITGMETGAGAAAPEGDEEIASAEEHPIIKAARARERLRYGGAGDEGRPEPPAAPAGSKRPKSARRRKRSRAPGASAPRKDGED